MEKIDAKTNPTSSLGSNGDCTFELHRFYTLESQERARRAKEALTRAEELMHRSQVLIERSRRLR